MVIPGNLPAQLRVLDSSLQLYTPLFLASYSRSNPYSFPQNSQRKTPFLPLTLLFSLFPFSLFRICLPHDLCCSHIFYYLFLPRLPVAAFSATFSAATFSVPLLLQLQKARLIPYGHSGFDSWPVGIATPG